MEGLNITLRVFLFVELSFLWVHVFLLQFIFLHSLIHITVVTLNIVSKIFFIYLKSLIFYIISKINFIFGVINIQIFFFFNKIFNQ